MSRSGYSDDIDNWALIRWRGRVTSAMRGKRGQRFFKDLVAALDAMPEKRLVAEALQADGSFCAMGAVLHYRGLDPSVFDPEDNDAIAKALDIATPLAQETAYENDEVGEHWVQPGEDFEAKRWRVMRKWAMSHLLPDNMPADAKDVR